MKVNGFKEMAEICNIIHLRTCNCQHKNITKVSEKAIQNNSKQLNEYKDQPQIYNSRVEAIKDRSLQIVADYCVEKIVRCPYEIKEIKEIVGLFKEKYKLEDPRVYIIIKSLIAHKLSAVRMQRYSNAKGILQEYQDKEGNLRYALNPVEGAKLAYDNAVIKAVEVLNRIVDGELIKHEGKIDLSHILSKIEDMAKTENS